MCQAAEVLLGRRARVTVVPARTWFAEQRPLAFGLSVTGALLVAYIVAGVAAAGITVDSTTRPTVEALGRLCFAGVFAWVIWRAGLAGKAGLARAGRAHGWLFVALALAFQVPIALWAFFGGIVVPVPDWAGPGAVALNGAAAGVLEELAFRGLLLLGLLRALRGRKEAMVMSVVYSSLLFGASHLIRLAMGQPVAAVSLLVLDAAVSGIFYAGVVLYSGSVWPAVAHHVVPNAVVGALAGIGSPFFPGYT
jgi:membrane protease YdiL (CAAX protease family)